MNTKKGERQKHRTQNDACLLAVYTPAPVHLFHLTFRLTFSLIEAADRSNNGQTGAGEKLAVVILVLPKNTRNTHSNMFLVICQPPCSQCQRFTLSTLGPCHVPHPAGNFWHRACTKHLTWELSPATIFIYAGLLYLVRFHQLLVPWNMLGGCHWST